MGSCTNCHNPIEHENIRGKRKFFDGRVGEEIGYCEIRDL